MRSRTGQINAATLTFAACLAIGGCAEVPQLDDIITPELERADFPALVPLETLLVPLPGPADRADTLRSDLLARRDRLQDRARRLNETPVVDDETAARMKAGVQG